MKLMRFIPQTCLAAAAMACIAAAPAASATGTATTTTLAITAGGSAVITVASGTVVTLTASVKAGSTPVTAGQINFCDATAAYCEDIHILGSVNLTGTGSASYKFRPGPGVHSYKAVFLASPTDATSTSSAAALTVTPPSTYPTATQFSVAGTAGNYTLTSTVGTNGPTAPTGSVSFNDLTEGDTIGTANLSANTSAGANFVDQIQLLKDNLYPQNVIVADFNNDGIPDFAAIYRGYSRSSFIVYLGNGDGTFTSAGAETYFSSIDVQLVSGDFNGDGIPDLAATYVTESGNTYVSSVLVYLGDGTGKFTAQTPLTLTSGDYRNPLAVIDFNNDGIADLAVGTGTSIEILLGQGNGSFSALSQQVGSSSPGQFLGVADFNGDGVPDLIAYQSSALQVFLGNGDGTFSAGPSFTPPANCGDASTNVDPVIADFNNDGIADLALACAVYNANSKTYSSSVQLMLGTGTGAFTVGNTASISNSQSVAGMTAADINGDGNVDLAIATAGIDYPDDVAATFVTLLGDGDGALTATPNNVSFIAGNDPGPISAGDFNGDGTIDLLIVEGTYVTDLPYQYDYGFADMLLNENHTATATLTGAAVLPAGSGMHQVNASYTGTPASTSDPYTLSSGQGTESFGFSYSANPAQYGTAVTITVKITGSGNTPTGYITPYDGSTMLAYDLPLDSTGSASFTYSTPSTGSHSISVFYYGDSNYGENSAYSTLTVAGDGSTSTVVSSNSTSVAQGLNATFTATVKGGGVEPTGTVTFYDGNTKLGTGTLNSSGMASYVTSSLSLGTHSITAVYGGDSNYAGSTSAVYTQTITPPITPSVTLTPSATTISTTQAITVKVVVNGGSGNPTPTGLVGLSGGGYSGQAELSGGSATFSIAAGALNAGTDTLTAAYTGTTPYASASGTTSVTVYNAANAATITSPAAGSTFTGSSVTFNWTTATGGTGYYLWIGSTGVGSNNIYNSAEKTVTSYTFTQMPVNGETIYVRLNTNFSGTWVSRDYTYTAYRAPATMTSPTSGSTFTGSSVTFNWTAATGATGYYLLIGSTGQGSNNIYNSAEKTTTSYTFTQMPTNGETIYVRLATNYNGTWVSNYYTYKAAPNAAATMISPAQGATLPGASVTFNWTAESAATGYYLMIGSTGQGSDDIYDSAEKTTTSYTFTRMPTNGETIYVRLATNYNGTWVNSYYTYTAAN